MKRSSITVLTVGAIALALFCFSRNPATPETPPLTYRGQSADFWFARIPVTIVGAGARGFISALGQQYGPTNIANISGVEAFDAMGTNAVGYLLLKLEGTDSLPEKAITSAAAKAQVKSIPFRNAETERMQAVTALIDIKLLPQDVQARLEQLSTNAELKEVAEAAAYVLKCRADGTTFPIPGNESAEHK